MPSNVYEMSTTETNQWRGCLPARLNRRFPASLAAATARGVIIAIAKYRGCTAIADCDGHICRELGGAR